MNAFRALAAVLLVGLFLFPLNNSSAKLLDDGVDIVESGELSSWGFSPTILTVSAGTTVTWKNTGASAHSITSQDQLFDSRLLDAGKSWSYTFDTPGTYRYFCVPRPWMKGTIVVTADERGGGRASDRENPREPDRDEATRTPTAVPTATSTTQPTATPSPASPTPTATP